MGKVYISQENSNIDYTEAKKFGETVFVTDLEYSLVDNSLKNEKINERIEEVTRMFDPLNDSMVMTGSPITFGLLFHSIATKCKVLEMPVKILVWDRRIAQYRSIVLNINN